MNEALPARKTKILQANIGKALPFVLTGISALGLTVSFPSFDLGFFAWFSLSPFLFALRQRNTYGAIGIGLLFGFLFTLGTFSWLSSVNSVGIGRFVLLIAPVIAIYYLIFGLVYRLFSEHIGPWIIIGAPSLWVALEYTRANLFFLACPWNLLGHSQYLYVPVIQFADIASVYGISFIIVMVNQFLSQLPDSLIIQKEMLQDNATGSARSLKLIGNIFVPVMILTLSLIYGWSKTAETEGGKHLRVGLVQANLVARDYMPGPDQQEYLQQYVNLTKEVAKGQPELIVWPASSLPAPIERSMLVRYTIKKLTRETGIHLLVGGAGLEKMATQSESHHPYSNSEFLIDPSGYVIEQYNKIKLLPFNEYLPLQNKFKWPRWITPLRKSFIPGEKRTLFQVSEARFGTPICWENMFPGFFRHFKKNGANLMISVTNEAFYGHTAAPYQSLASNVFRAVENRVAIARSAPTGVSAFINPDGKIVTRVSDGKGNDLFVSGILIKSVPLTNDLSFYTLYGDIFAYITICVTGLLILVSLYARKNKRLSNEESK